MSERIYSNPGSPIRPVYTPKFNDDGTFDLVMTGKENIQEYIDSFAEETCIDTIIKRCQMGDTSALSKVQGTYGDFTEVPKNFRDLLQFVIDGRNYFDSLPVDIKAYFGNSFDQWTAQIGSDEWYRIMAMTDKKSNEPIGIQDKDSEVIKE